MANQTKKLAVTQALEYAKTCTVKQLSITELKDVIEYLTKFYTNNKQEDGKQQW